MSSFDQLDLPCNHEVQEGALAPLEAEIQAAFDGGYAGLVNVVPLKLFQWFSKLLYGLVYAELQVAFSDEDTAGPLGISPSLITRFQNLHLLLQSLTMPMEFEDFQPWSLVLIPLHPSEGRDVEQALDYRDEMTTMVFSMSFGDVGILVALHDSARNEAYHGKLLSAFAGETLNALQFRELTARFFYSAYLFQPIPHYLILEPTAALPVYSVSQQPIEGLGMRPVFKTWENKVYAQVLEAVWKPWALDKRQILREDGSVMTSLLDGEGKLMKHPERPVFA